MPGIACWLVVAVRQLPRWCQTLVVAVERPRRVEVRPFPSSRWLVTAAMRAGRSKIPMYGLVDVDITAANRPAPACHQQSGHGPRHPGSYCGDRPQHCGRRARRPLRRRASGTPGERRRDIALQRCLTSPGWDVTFCSVGVGTHLGPSVTASGLGRHSKIAHACPALSSCLAAVTAVFPMRHMHAARRAQRGPMIWTGETGRSGRASATAARRCGHDRPGCPRSAASAQLTAGTRPAPAPVSRRKRARDMTARSRPPGCTHACHNGRGTRPPPWSPRRRRADCASVHAVVRPRPAAVVGIKAFHTHACLSIESCAVYVFWTGVRRAITQAIPHLARSRHEPHKTREAAHISTIPVRDTRT